MGNILVHVGHPAHVHFFRHAIKKIEGLGHSVHVTCVEKEHALQLMEEYGIPHQKIGVHKSGLAQKIGSMLSYDKKLVKLMREKKIDAAAAVGSPSVAQAAWLARKPSIIFTDTEAAGIGNKLMAPFATHVATPECYRGSFGKKHIKYAGYQELAYLHPNYFRPDERVLSENGLSGSDVYSVVRFVSRVSLHDRGDRGLGVDPASVVEELESYGRVLVSSEGPLPHTLQGYGIKSSPGKIHSLLYYASLYVGESPTMASEAAMLGTPSIYAQQSFRGYTEELEERYGIVLNFHNPVTLKDACLGRAVEILSDPGYRNKWAEGRERMLSEKIDVTDFIVKILLNAAE